LAKAILDLEKEKFSDFSVGSQQPMEEEKEVRDPFRNPSDRGGYFNGLEESN